MQTAEFNAAADSGGFRKADNFLAVAPIDLLGQRIQQRLQVIIDALQLSAKYHVATPANGQPGDDTVVLPFISDEKVERMFAEQGGFRKVRSYLRFMRDSPPRCL